MEALGLQQMIFSHQDKKIEFLGDRGSSTVLGESSTYFHCSLCLMECHHMSTDFRGTSSLSKNNTGII